MDCALISLHISDMNILRVGKGEVDDFYVQPCVFLICWRKTIPQ